MYSIKSIIGRTIEIISGIFFHAKKIPDIKIEGITTTYHYLSVVLIIKNEAVYIQEWIEYHRLIGIEHFYIYDNESTDNLRHILDKYISDGIVTYIYLPGQCMQIAAYNDAVARYNRNNLWMGFIDSDEFFVLADCCDIKDFLKNYENVPAIGINWIMFDSNGHDTIPSKGFVIENFTRTYKNTNHPNNKHIKTIAQASKIKYFNNPHFCILKSFLKIVDEEQLVIRTPEATQNKTNKIRLNHYFSKSKQELIKKINRGRADIKEKRHLAKSQYDFTEEGVQTTDISLSSYAEKLRKIIPETYNQGNQ